MSPSDSEPCPGHTPDCHRQQCCSEDWMKNENLEHKDELKSEENQSFEDSSASENELKMKMKMDLRTKIFEASNIFEASLQHCYILWFGRLF